MAPPIHFEASEESSDESETTTVSIHNMPLISIVEEDDFNAMEVSGNLRKSLKMKLA